MLLDESASIDAVACPTSSNVRLGASVWPKQIPPIAFEVTEHGDAPIRFRSRRGDKLHSRGQQPRVGRIKISNAEEQAYPTGELSSDNRRLLVTVGAGEKHAGLRTARAHDDPTLRSPVIGRRRHVFDQLEFQHVDKECNRRIIIAYNERYEFKMRHLDLEAKRAATSRMSLCT